MQYHRCEIEVANGQTCSRGLVMELTAVFLRTPRAEPAAPNITPTFVHLSTPSHNRKQEAMYPSESGWYVGHVEPKYSRSSLPQGLACQTRLAENTTPRTH